MKTFRSNLLEDKIEIEPYKPSLNDEWSNYWLVLWYKVIIVKVVIII